MWLAAGQEVHKQTFHLKKLPADFGNWGSFGSRNQNKEPNDAKQILLGPCFSMLSMYVIEG